ncbi:MAG: hypothetical protein AB7F32_12935 [Victivallaceae bacterium]
MKIWETLKFKLIDARAMRRTPGELPPLCYFAVGDAVPAAVAERFAGNLMRRRVLGVDNQMGMLIYPGPGFLEYSPEKYDFKPCGEKLYLGFRRDFTPDMVRRDMVYGSVKTAYEVTMANGEKYSIPIALPSAPRCSLPMIDKIGASGAWEKSVSRPELVFLADAAERIFEAITGDGVLDGIDEDTMRRIAVEAIRVLYDLSELEIGVRGLLGGEAYSGIAEAMLDTPAIHEILEKKKLEESGTGSGDRV